MEQHQLDSALFEVAEVQLIYKSKVKASERLMVKTSAESYDLLLQLWELGKIDFVEQFNVLLLNRLDKVIGIFRVSTGGITGTVADPRLIFGAAIKAKASGIILSHNHPSGNLNPSREDNALTSKIKNAGNLLDIRVLDHIIVTSDGYYSFADEGLL
jgi:DNA repair protein RadC